MSTNSVATGRTRIPKRRQRHYSYDESVDESAKLIADEPVAVESEAPADESEPVERVEGNDEAGPPAFEE